MICHNLCSLPRHIASKAHFHYNPTHPARPKRHCIATQAIAVETPPTTVLETVRISGSNIQDGGPPRFSSPLPPPNAPTDRVSLPLLIYLPGIDGTGLAAARQFPNLLQKFDMRVFVVPVYDRLSFTDLKSLVRDYLQHEVKFHPATRPVYILGESFGGLLAIAAALDSPELVDRLVLVNPATSFSQTIWPVIGPLLTQLPRDVFESALPIAMAPILGNPVGLLASALDNIPQGESITNVAAKLSQAALDLLAQLPELAKILPPETLAHKLEQLALGSDEIEGRLGEVQQRCLILVGDADMLLPSGEEGKRLERQLPRAQLREFRGRSHAFLQEGGIHLSNILIEEGFYVKERRMSAPLKKRASGAASFGSAVPVELPTDAELERYAERTTALGKRLTSPVFLSTAADGSIAYGLGNVPNRQLGKSILFVGNHQTLALDIGVLTEELIRQKGILPRGLAHPVIFSDSFGGDNGGDKEAIGNTEEMSQNNSSTKTTTGLAPWDLIPALSNFMLNSNAGGGIGNRRQDRSSSSSLS